MGSSPQPGVGGCRSGGRQGYQPVHRRPQVPVQTASPDRCRCPHRPVRTPEQGHSHRQCRQYTFWNDRTADLADSSYPKTILEAEDSGLLDPAPAALALTVGALCPDHGQGATSLGRRRRDTCRGARKTQPSNQGWSWADGHGQAGARAPGGSLAVDSADVALVDMRDPSVRVIGAGAGWDIQASRRRHRTSYAAPLVTHAALRILGHYPRLSANAVRALLLCSAPGSRTRVGPGESRRAPAAKTHHWIRARLRAPRRSQRRSPAVLIAEDEIVVDDVHLYASSPVPETFYEPGGWRRLTAALAYDPPVRPTRLDYLASHMNVQVYFGVPVATVRAAYVKEAGAEDESPPELERYKRDLQPSSTIEARGPTSLRGHVQAAARQC